MDVMLFGPPGAGKGTQATSLASWLGVPHISTGDIFRRHLKEGTELGLLARGYMNSGGLVPDAVVFDIVASRLTDADAMGGALYDGFPRTIAQAELLLGWLAERGRRVDRVINLALDDAVVIKRLSGRRTCLSCGATYHVENQPPAQPGVCDRCNGEVVQRKDDAEQTVQDRVVTYHRETAPVLAWLNGRAPITTLDADRTIATVWFDIRAAFETR